MLLPVIRPKNKAANEGYEECDAGILLTRCSMKFSWNLDFIVFFAGSFCLLLNIEGEDQTNDCPCNGVR